MNISDAFPSKYVKAEDLAGRDVTVTIKSCTLEDIILGEEPKAVLRFRDARKRDGLERHKQQDNNQALRP